MWNNASTTITTIRLAPTHDMVYTTFERNTTIGSKSPEHGR